MAAGDTREPFGTSLEYDLGGGFVEFSNVLSITPPTRKRVKIEWKPMNGTHSYTRRKPGTKDMDAFKCVIAREPDIVQTLLTIFDLGLIDWKLTTSDDAEVETFSGFIEEMPSKMELDQLEEIELTIAIDGPSTIAA